MSSSDEQDTPPKISEDEVGKTSVSALYRKELEQAFYPIKASCSNFTRDVDEQIGSLTEKQEGDIKSTLYNEWKSKNHHLFTQSSVNSSRSPELVSCLGQNLKHAQSYIPVRSPQHDQFDEQFKDNSPIPPLHSKNKSNKPVNHDSRMHTRLFTNHNCVPCEDEFSHLRHYGCTETDVPQNQFLRYQDSHCKSSTNLYPYLEEKSNKGTMHPYVQYDPNMSPNCRPSQNYFCDNTPPDRATKQIYPNMNHNHAFTHRSPKDLNIPYQNFNPSGFTPTFTYNLPTNPYVGQTCMCDSKQFKLKSRELEKNEKLKNKQITDLYRIVWLQNEQLALLQSQVKKLIEITTKSDDLNSGKYIDHEKKKIIKGTKEMRAFNLSVIEENKNLTEKVSVGIMTSFVENGFAKGKPKKKSAPTKQNSSSASVTTDSSSTEESTDENVLQTTPMNKSSKRNKKKVWNRKDESFTLHGVEIPTVVENLPSPQTSFHLEMQDYKSTSSESEESDSDGNSVPQVGWTFYDAVVEKVNEMLKRSTEEKEVNEDDIRNATIEHLKQLGISLVEPDNQAPKRVTFGQGTFEKMHAGQPAKLQADSDTSLRMNALASKYLAGQQFVQNEKIKEATSLQQNNCNSNLSFATMRYLEKYRLVPHLNSNDHEEETVKDPKEKLKKKKVKKCKEKKSKSGHSRLANTGKILDITAIKQQPKLLPKNI